MQTQPSTPSANNAFVIGSTQVSGDRTGMDKESLSRAFFEHLFYSAGTDQKSATLRDHYIALSNVVRDRSNSVGRRPMRPMLQSKPKLSATYLPNF